MPKSKVRKGRRTTPRRRIEMTEQPQQPPQQESDAEKVVRAQHIIDAARRRIAEEIDHSLGLESRISMLESQVQQEATIRQAMVQEITTLRERLSEYEPVVEDADPDNLTGIHDEPEAEPVDA